MAQRTPVKRPHGEIVEDHAWLPAGMCVQHGGSDQQRGRGAYSMPEGHASSHFGEGRLALSTPQAQVQAMADLAGELSWVSSLTHGDTRVDDAPAACPAAPRAGALARPRVLFLAASEVRCRASHGALMPPPACVPGSMCCISTRMQAWGRQRQRWQTPTLVRVARAPPRSSRRLCSYR